MGNMQCPADDAAHLAAVARDICPFPNYNPSPLFNNMLSINSSVHLRDHYRTVQSSLTPKQLEDFTQDLRTTFGREGKVTLGGVGVVALSLAVLFDALARKARGEWEPESGPIPGLFLKNLRGYYPPQVYTISEYLRLVPHIANNPTRMRKETQRYLRQLELEDQSLKQGDDGVTGIDYTFSHFFKNSLEIHLLRIANSTVESVTTQMKSNDKPVPAGNTTDTAADVGKTRKRRIPAPELSVIFDLNCDADAASEEFLTEVHKSNDTQEAFKRCQPFNRHLPKTWLHFIARLVWLDVINNPAFDYHYKRFLLIDQREDFDLKANALRKWTD